MWSISRLNVNNFSLLGYRCCWCQRSTHVNCFVKAADTKVCDFGNYRNLIIPPNHVFMKRRRLQRITSIVTPEWPEWKPLIVVGMTCFFITV